jgi:hypothetical protein
MAINVPKVNPGDLITASSWNLVVDSLISLQSQIDALGTTGPTPLAPVITSVDPSPDVPTNTTMTIHGSNFAVPASLNTVTVDGTVLNDFQSGSTNQVLVVGVPGNLSGVPGTKQLVVATASGGPSAPFSVHFVAPVITLAGQVQVTNVSGDVGTITAGTPVLFQFHLDGTALNVPEQYRIVATYENATGGVAAGAWDAATTYIGTTGSDHQVTVSPLSPVNVSISVVPPTGGTTPAVDLKVKAVSVHNDPESSSLPQTVHIAVGEAPPAADPSMTITLGTNLRSTVHPNSSGTGLDIRYGATAPITIDAVMGHHGSYEFVGAIDDPDDGTGVWQILDLPETIVFGDGQGQPIQFRLKLIPTSPPASPVARTFTLTATRKDDDAFLGISNFLSFPIGGFTP